MSFSHIKSAPAASHQPVSATFLSQQNCFATYALPQLTMLHCLHFRLYWRNIHAFPSFNLTTGPHMSFSFPVSPPIPVRDQRVPCPVPPTRAPPPPSGAAARSASTRGLLCWSDSVRPRFSFLSRKCKCSLGAGTTSASRSLRRKKCRRVIGVREQWKREDLNRGCSTRATATCSQDRLYNLRAMSDKKNKNLLN